jgi:hypothetical protein
MGLRGLWRRWFSAPSPNSTADPADQPVIHKKFFSELLTFVGVAAHRNAALGLSANDLAQAFEQLMATRDEALDSHLCSEVAKSLQLPEHHVRLHIDAFHDRYLPTRRLELQTFYGLMSGAFTPTAPASPPAQAPADVQRQKLYSRLLTQVFGDHAAADRLIEFERRKAPSDSPEAWIQAASRRIQEDNTGRWS